MGFPKYEQPKVGRKYGNLIVTKISRGQKGGIVSVECKCKCGNICYSRRTRLINGTTIACPTCAVKIRGKKIAKSKLKYPFIPKKHLRRIQNIIFNAIERCHNKPNKYYKLRGISVCSLWRNNKQEFAKYLLTLPGWDNPNLVIDRIDNNGNYEPGNLRFVTQSISNLNRRPFNQTN